MKMVSYSAARKGQQRSGTGERKEDRGGRHGKEALQEQMGGIAAGKAEETERSRKTADSSAKQVTDNKPA